MEEYLEEDGYLEEEEMLSFEEDGKMSKKGRSGGNAIPGTRVKRTRVFRIKRGMERQRGETIERYMPWERGHLININLQRTIHNYNRNVLRCTYCGKDRAVHFPAIKFL